MPYDLCRHIRTNGLRCQSPSLNRTTWCFYHGTLHARHQVFRHTEATRGYLIPGQHIELAALEDRQAIQLALSIVINALATGQLETRRATALLYGLQVASANAAHLDDTSHQQVQTATQTSEGLDLAQPEQGELPHYNPEDYVDDDDDDDDEEDDD
jgi:hypothetical protein